jgi:vacuolar iron transporter family protein
MNLRRRHLETHRTDRVGWLRAAVLGAGDGMIAIGGLVIGMSAVAIAAPGSAVLVGRLFEELI